MTGMQQDQKQMTNGKSMSKDEDTPTTKHCEDMLPHMSSSSTNDTWMEQTQWYWPYRQVSRGTWNWDTAWDEVPPALFF